MSNQQGQSMCPYDGCMKEVEYTIDFEKYDKDTIPGDSHLVDGTLYVHAHSEYQ